MGKNKKVFIAQPMAGVREKEIERIRKRIIKQVKEVFGKDTIILDQFHIEDNQEDIERVKDHTNGTRIYRLGRSLQLMAEADLVIFAGDTIKNCENAKGYKAELAICEIYDKPKLSEHELSEYIRDARWLKRRIKECHANIQKLKEPTDCIFGGPAEEVIDNGDGTTTVIKR